MLRKLLPAFFLALAGPAAHADCADDIAALQHRLDAALDQKVPNILAANKQLAKATDPLADEASCDDHVALAWKAYRTKPPEAPPPADDTPPNLDR